MSCTNGCNDCKCEPIEIKDKTTTIRDFSDKLRVLNEFGCLISITPCSQLGRLSLNIPSICGVISKMF